MNFSARSSFRRKDLVIELTQNKRAKPAFDNNLKFGHYKTDHLFLCDWEDTKGWDKPQIIPYQHFSIDPMNSTLHYAIECFEGLKAYKDTKGRQRLFRSNLNMYRFKQSCKRIGLPDFDGLELLECLKELVKLEKDWIPDKEGFSLYIRPTAISMCDRLGVAFPDKSRIYIVCSPIGPYYPSGFNPIKLYCDIENIRAFPKGTGSYKIGCNYGPTILPASKAIKKGYDQILWLCGDNVGEVGTSNIFFFWKNEEGELELATPNLDGTILPGVIRDSVIQLAKQMNKFKVSERTIKIQEVVRAINEERKHLVLVQLQLQVQQIKFHIMEQITRSKLIKKQMQEIQHMNYLIKQFQYRYFKYGKVEHPWSILLD